MRILALDVGNTSVAAARFDAIAGDGSAADSTPAWHEHRVRGSDESAEIEHWSARVRAETFDLCVVGSVHTVGKSLAEALRGVVVAAGRSPDSVVLLDRGDLLPIQTDVREPARIGVDRMAGAFAASVLAGGAAISVLAGTAITTDWVDAARVFRGGAIVPGRRLCARALNAYTDRLPDVGAWESDVPLRLPGQSTEEAIRHGLEVGLPALVEGLVRDLRRAASEAAGANAPSVAVFLSGGDGAWLRRRALADARHVPSLVPYGLALAAKALAR